MAQRLDREGIKLGDRVATLAWNTWRHLEAWYGIVGIGAIYHTVNPRLFPDQIVWIVNHAEDRLMMVDLTFVPILEKIADRLPTIERYIILTDAAHMPQTTLKNAVAYEDWITEADGDFEWRSFDENTAAGMCYTSGTNRQSQGRRLLAPLQRAARLHGGAADSQGHPLQRRGDAGGADVPRQLLVARLLDTDGRRHHGDARRQDGRRFDLRTARHLQSQLHRRGADGMADAAARSGKDRRQAALPQARGDRRLGLPARHDQDVPGNYGVEVVHAWGMTEMSPLGALCTLKPEYAGLTGEALLDVQMKQGHPPFGVEMKITDDNGRELPWDGKTFGRLKVRGPAVAKAYYKGEGAEVFEKDGCSTPATSRPWTNTAICRSPTAPRT